MTNGRQKPNTPDPRNFRTDRLLELLNSLQPGPEHFESLPRNSALINCSIQLVSQIAHVVLG
eukprot:628312-Pyramimonas_sp.AAC.1